MSLASDVVDYEDVVEKGVYLNPTGFHVLILPDPIDDGVADDDDVYHHESGIVIPKKTEFGKEREREKAGQVYGKVVAVGPLCWADFDRFASREGGWHKWANVGDHVTYARYSAKLITDPVTDITYALVNDRDITAVIAKREGA